MKYSDFTFFSFSSFIYFTRIKSQASIFIANNMFDAVLEMELYFIYFETQLNYFNDWKLIFMIKDLL